MKPSPKSFEAIVVGSGPGGATVAKELSEKGKSVLILEWGDNNPVKGTFLQTLTRAFIPGKGLLITGQGLGLVRGITTGGSSLLYCGTAFEPPFEMLKAYGVDITGEMEALRHEVPMEPLSDGLMSPAGKIFLKSTQELGYNSHKLNKFIDQTRCRANCADCCYGCPVGAKWNARNFVNQAVDKGAHLINQAKVSKVIVENRQAVGVEYSIGKDNYQAFGDKVIVAAGGIGSPLILRESGIRSVGYDFFFDPLIYVFGKIKGLKSAKGIPMSAGIHFPEDGIVMTDFNMPRILKFLFDLEVFRFGKALAYSDYVPIMIKIRDDLGGRIGQRGWVWKNLKKQDKLRINQGVEHAKRILTQAGATNIYKSWLLAAHPGGTVKIGEVVDRDLKTKFKGLYVCDCSVIPEEWGLPPTLTLLALGKRLARHLIGVDQAAEAAAGTQLPDSFSQAVAG